MRVPAPSLAQTLMSLILAFLITALAGPLAAQAEQLIPERRLVITENTDLPGQDLTQLFDVSLAACQRACLSDPRCTALTFNARTNSCFPKSGAGAAAPYQGAYSAIVLRAAPGAESRAQVWAEIAAAVLSGGDLDRAQSQARDLSALHLSGDFSATELADMARGARLADDLAASRRLIGAAVNQSDDSALWLDYARDLMEARGNTPRATGDASAAAVNGYLRATSDAAAAESLHVLAMVRELSGQGRGALAALRLAAELSHREDIAAALAEAEGKYGFRVTDHSAETRAAQPRLCAEFSEPLSEAQDYAPYVELPAPGLPVEAEGNRLCIGGLDYGNRVTLTLRAGLPSATGDALSRDVALTQYLRDRDPVVRFEGRAFILPGAADAGLPVVTVNAEQLDLTLMRVADGNLVRLLRDNYMARPMDQWDARYLSAEMAETVWQGQADVARQLNEDVTTRLPIQDITGPLGAGIYALQAQVAGTDPGDIAPATQWFVVSDLGISALAGQDGLVAVLRGLSDTGPRAGVEMRLISRGNAVLGRALTDAQGIARFDAGLTRGTGNAAPAALVAEAGDDLAFLPLTDPEFDLSDRGVEGAPPAPPVDLFLSTDRGAYRAGEAVNATVLARSGADQRALAGLPLTAVLMRPDGVEFTRALAPEAGAGGHVLRFDLPATAPRGTWRLDVFADTGAAPLASARLLVEDFLPERIDFTPQMPDGPLALSDTPEITLEARYLFGAPAAGLASEGELRLSAADSLPGHEGYHFGRHDARFDALAETLPAGQTDAAGRLSLRAALPDPGNAPTQPLRADLRIALTEGSGRPVERRLSRIVMPAAPVIGIRPLFEGGAVASGEAARFALIALGAGGAPGAQQADWVINRVEIDYQWYSLNGRWDYEPVTRRSRVSAGAIDISAGQPAEVALPVEWGRYELVVTPRGGDGAASIGFDAGWYTASGQLQTPDRLGVSLDRADYAVGDQATLRIEAPAAGVGLVSVLSNRVVDLRIVDLVAGENRVELPVSDGWGTGAYVTVSAIRALGGAGASHAPMRAIGLAHARIAPGDRALSAVIEAPAQADPRGQLPVRLRVEGTGARYATLAAVDLGILNLTGFDAPDPQVHYFGQRRLGVALRDVYGRLIDGRAGAPGLLRSGGDAQAGLSMQSPPPTEELMAWFSGPLELGADGTVQTEVPLPEFNGTVRLMAVAWSDKGVGQAQADVIVRDPVVLTASAPRFLAPGDQARVALELTHADGPAGQVGLEALASGLTLGALPGEVTLEPGGTARVNLPITAPDAATEGRLELALLTPAGQRLTKTLVIPTVANGPEISRQSRFELAAGSDLSLPVDLLAGFRPGQAQATLTVGPAARFDAGAILRGLARYPYGCTEQVTSQALPLLSWAPLAEGLPGVGQARQRIDEAIRTVLTRQASNGAFGLWSPRSGDGWLDAYVTDFLSRARAAGHEVPDTAMRMALDNLRNQVNYAPDFDAASNGGGEALAYQLMVLAREGAAAVGDLRYYADQKAGDFGSPFAVAQLGAALAMYGDQPRADALFARAAARLHPPGPEGQTLRADYGTRLRDRAGVLALAASSGSTALPIGDLGGSLADSLMGQALSPQEAVWSLMAAGALSATAGEGFTLNGAPLQGAQIRDVTGQGGAVLHNGSAADEVVTLTLTGQPLTPEPAGGKGYTISRGYYTPEGVPVDPSLVAQGTRLIAVLTITPHGGGSGRLMVDDPLPAGFEIDNPHLIQSGDIAALDWLEPASGAASEFRSDRFLTAIDWSLDQSFRLAYGLRAITPGRFAHPAASVVDMYRPDYRAWTESGEVSVTE